MSVPGFFRDPRIQVYINGVPYQGRVTINEDHIRLKTEVGIYLPKELPEGLVLHSLDEVIRLWVKESK
jgi:hypothetical protein